MRAIPPKVLPSKDTRAFSVITMRQFFLVAILAASAFSQHKNEDNKSVSDEEVFEASESQSYGFGYGTKVADKYSVATGEVHKEICLYDPLTTLPYALMRNRAHQMIVKR